MTEHAPLRERFWRRLVVNVGAPHECWDWPGGVGAGGYGCVRKGGAMAAAHRVSYELNVGPIPAERIVHHRCANKLCCNPAHLELTTRRDHPDSVGGMNSAKTRCKHGHPLAGANLYICPRGKRECRECRREARRRWEAK